MNSLRHRPGLASMCPGMMRPPSQRGATYTPSCGEPKWTVTTKSTIASSTTPAPASQIHGTAVHRTAFPPCSALPKVLTHSTYSAVGRRSGSTTVTKTRSMASSTGEHLGQIYQHPGRRSPNVAALIRQHKEYARAMLEVARRTAMVLRVHHKGERHLEHLGDLERVDSERKRHFDDADDRGDLEPGPGHISIEPADHRDMVPRQPDFLLGLAQRRLSRIGVALLDASAGKRNLPGMRRQMRGALGQQHGHALGAVDERDQHRGRAQSGARRRHPWVEIVIAAGRLPQSSGFNRIGRSAKAASSGSPELQETFDNPVWSMKIRRCQWFGPDPPGRVGSSLPIRFRFAQLKEHPAAPHPELRRLSARVLRPEFNELVEHRPRERALECAARQNIGRRLAARSRCDAQRVVGSRRHKFVQIGAEYQSLVATFAVDRHRYGEKGDIVDLDAAALGRGDQPITAIRLTAQNGGEELDERQAADGRSAIKPATVARDPHVEIAAVGRRPPTGRGSHL